MKNIVNLGGSKEQKFILTKISGGKCFKMHILFMIFVILKHFNKYKLHFIVHVLRELELVYLWLEG